MFITKISLLQVFCNLYQHRRPGLSYVQILNANFRIEVVKKYQVLIQLKSMEKTLSCLYWMWKMYVFQMALRLKMALFLSW